MNTTQNIKKLDVGNYYVNGSLGCYDGDLPISIFSCNRNMLVGRLLDGLQQCRFESQYRMTTMLMISKYEQSYEPEPSPVTMIRSYFTKDLVIQRGVPGDELFQKIGEQVTLLALKEMALRSLFRKKLNQEVTDFLDYVQNGDQEDLLSAVSLFSTMTADEFPSLQDAMEELDCLTEEEMKGSVNTVEIRDGDTGNRESIAIAVGYKSSVHKSEEQDVLTPMNFKRNFTYH